MDNYERAWPDLRSIRNAAAVPQGERTLRRYAIQVGITEPHLSRIERGLVGGMDVRIALAIERVYGVQVDWEAALPPLKAA